MLQRALTGLNYETTSRVSLALMRKGKRGQKEVKKRKKKKMM